MAEVELGVPQPRRHDQAVIRDLLVADRFESRQHRIFVSACDPVAAHDHAVLGEGGFVSAPHNGGGMVGPAPGLAVYGVEELEHLDSLFSAPLAIKHPRRHCKVRIGEKRLHYRTTVLRIIMK